MAEKRVQEYLPVDFSSSADHSLSFVFDALYFLLIWISTFHMDQGVNAVGALVLKILIYMLIHVWLPRIELLFFFLRRTLWLFIFPVFYCTIFAF